MVCQLSARILVIREVEASLGIRVPYQVEALQEPARVRSTSHLAAFVILRLQGLLLRALQFAQRDEACLGHR